LLVRRHLAARLPRAGARRRHGRQRAPRDTLRDEPNHYLMVTFEDFRARVLLDV